MTANAPLTVQRVGAATTAGEGMALPAAPRLDLGPSPYRGADREEGIRAWQQKRDPV